MPEDRAADVGNTHKNWAIIARVVLEISSPFLPDKQTQTY